MVLWIGLFVSIAFNIAKLILERRRDSAARTRRRAASQRWSFSIALERKRLP